MAKNCSIKDIAALAGVSAATVSRVMNHAGGYSAETAKRVRKIAEEEGYFSEAQTMVYTPGNSLIGILVPDISNEYFANIVLELQSRLREQGFLTMICNVSESEEYAQVYVDELLRLRVSALIFVCGYGWDIPDVEIPVIYIDRYPMREKQDIVIIESDNVRGGYLAAKELIRCGCRRIAFLTDSILTSTKKARYKGYVRALWQAGLPMRDDLLINVGHQEEERVKERIRRVLEEDPGIDGILCATDRLAVGAILGCFAGGKRVPEDICITGFDDGRIASVFHPGITSVKQDGAAMAKKASEILMTLLEGGVLEKKRCIVPISLSVRESTAR